MDIGSNSDNLLRLAPCSVLLSSRTYVPPVDQQAEASVVWTGEAEARMEQVPAAFRGITRTAINRYALERGHSVVSSSIIDLAVGEVMPEHAARAMGITQLSPPFREGQGRVPLEAETWICRRCGRAARAVKPVACPVCESTEFQAVDHASIAAAATREGALSEEEAFDGFKVKWTAEAKEVLNPIPKGYERRRVKARIEKLARVRRLPSITRDFAQANLDEAYAPVAEVVSSSVPQGSNSVPPPVASNIVPPPQSSNIVPPPQRSNIVPPTQWSNSVPPLQRSNTVPPPQRSNIVPPPQGEGRVGVSGAATAAATGWVATPGAGPEWTDEAAKRLERVPAGFMRSLAKTKVEEFARKIHADTITVDVAEGGLADARDLMNQALRAYAPEVVAAAKKAHGNGDGDQSDPSPGWTEDGVRRLNEVEIIATEKFEPARARELAQHAAESRAARTSEAINAAFLERLGIKIGYGHPLSPKTFEHYFTWTPEAEARLAELPSYCRELSRWRVEWTAFKKELGPVITPSVMDVKFDMWGQVSTALQAKGLTMTWEPVAEQRLQNMPEFVKGQVMEAIEGNARELGAERVTSEVMDRVIEKWITTGDFHEGRYGFRA
jgi:hypothetical protein